MLRKSTGLVLIVSCLNLDCLIFKRFLDKFWGNIVRSLILPASYIEVVLIITLSFTLCCLVFLTEVSTTAFVSAQCVVSDKLTHCDEVIKVNCLIQLNVKTFSASRDEEVCFEFLAESIDLLKTFLKSFSSTSHTYIFPADMSEFLMDRINRTLTLNVHEVIYTIAYSLLYFCKLRSIS